MTPDIARAALEFLSRVDLKGNEAEAMVMVKQSLTIMVRSGEAVEGPTLVTENEEAEAS